MILLAGIARLAWPEHLAATGFFVGFTWASSAVMLVLFVPDLVASEQARGTLRFALRLPYGEHLAFWSKVVFSVALLVGAAIGAYLVVNLVRVVTGGGPWLPLAAWLAAIGRPGGAVPLLVLGLAFWLLAVASWLPRGALAVPGALMVAALVLLPSYLVLGGDLWLVPHLPWSVPLLVHPALALLVAWASLVRGRRLGGGPLGSALRGGAVAALGSAALAGWVAVESREVSTVDPGRAAVGRAFLSLDERSVFVNTRGRHRDLTLGVVLDLERGTWRQLGAPGEAFFAPPDLDGSCLGLRGPQPLLLQARREDEVSYIDTATARVVQRAPWNLGYLDLIDRGRAAARATTPLRMPDGRRVWIFRRELEVEKGTGFEELPWDPRDVAVHAAGLGIAVHGGGQAGIYDLTRRRRYRLPTGAQGGSASVWVLPDRWLVGDRTLVRKRATWTRWRLYDPDTRVADPAPGMRDGDEVATLLDDGRALVIGASRQAGDVWGVDVARGTRVRFELPGVRTTERQGLSSLRDPQGSPIRTAGGRRVLRCCVVGQGIALTSHRVGTDELTPPVEADRFVGSEADATALVVHDNALERVDLTTGARARLFPVP